MPGRDQERRRPDDDEAGGAQLLVFVDDDERPSTDWLADLLATYDAHGAPAAVVGAVISDYEAEPEPWIAAGGFFDRRRLPTGTVVDVAATVDAEVTVSVCASRSASSWAFAASSVAWARSSVRFSSVREVRAIT